MKRCVYYVAYGKPAREQAKVSVASFRKFFPDIDIVASCDGPIGEDVRLDCPDVDVGGRYAKTAIYDLVPGEYDQILYLDADTEVVSSDGLFLYQIISTWDMVICTNPGKFHTARRMRRPDNLDECDATFRQIGTDDLIQLNGGVFAFQRNDRTEAFFRSWHEEWKRWGKRDQAALLRALWKNPLRLFVLNNVWNTVDRYVDDWRSYTAWLGHFPTTARRWTGTIQGRSDSKEAWDKVRAYKGG